MEAGESGADYVAFGAFFPTNTKETLHRPDPSILSWWSALFEPPCVAIGGITVENARPLVEAGADFLAVSAAIWNHPEGEALGVRAFSAVLHLSRLFLLIPHIHRFDAFRDFARLCICFML